jgi:hypothetical protein
MDGMDRRSANPIVQAQTAIAELNPPEIKTNREIHRWNKVEQHEKSRRSMEVDILDCLSRVARTSPLPSAQPSAAASRNLA